MMFEAQRYSLVLWDALYSMGAGFVVGFVYQVLSVFLYKGKVAVFIKDIATSVFFAVVVFSFSVSFANYKLVRWYNIAFALLGWVMFTPGFSHCWHRVIISLFTGVKNTTVKCAKGICGKLLNKTEKKVKKADENTQKNQTDLLKDCEVVLYN